MGLTTLLQSLVMLLTRFLSVASIALWTLGALLTVSGTNYRSFESLTSTGRF
jgi:hypothetical protein